MSLAASTLKVWEKGAEATVAKKFGKELRQVFFKNPTTGEQEEFYLIGQRDWSVILPITKEGMVVAVRQYKQGCHRVVLELPAGTADTGEDPEATAKRELLEETGYQAEQVIALGSPSFMATRNSWTRFYSFVALGCKKIQAAKIDTSEEIETLLIPWQEWVALCQTEVEDPSAITTTFKALPHVVK